MEKSNITLFACTLLCVCFLYACNSNKPTEPEVKKMEEFQDSLKKEEAQLNKDIETVQKSMQDLDKEFKKTN
ncbi:hypothetical protein [Pedobacter alpinus]|uniref:Lipoprotein n=1 Tax=Pedobacter alpinus TaxID=1590643 RepID=A0ABW5TQ90_9SPHI